MGGGAEGKQEGEERDLGNKGCLNKQGENDKGKMKGKMTRGK